MYSHMGITLLEQIGPQSCVRDLGRKSNATAVICPERRENSQMKDLFILAEANGEQLIWQRLSETHTHTHTRAHLP